MVVMEYHNIRRHAQRGGALIILVLILVVAGTTALFSVLDGSGVKIERDKKTAAALAKAKLALIAYSIRDLSPGTCSTNCPRPGDLPCPDTDNDGAAETSCGNAAGTTQQQSRIGRLPWKTLGLDDLRDGDGERLWYAVSNSYKYNTRTRPLNSDTNGTITLRNSTGTVVNDGSLSTGLVAIVFSPGPAIKRVDNIQQSRDAIQENVTSNYLDTAFGEDNASFVDGTVDGFISGPIMNTDGTVAVNDRILTFTRDEILPLVEQRVIAEAKNALLDYYTAHSFYPWPADFSDSTCLSAANLSACMPNVTSKEHGRIPANPTIAWNSTSILRGVSNGNWFQQNGWREVLHYALTSACAEGTINCNGIGSLLTLNNALASPDDQKMVILIASGHVSGTQSRANNAEKSIELNYLEGKNLAPSPPDNVYVRTSQLTTSINDRAVSIP